MSIYYSPEVVKVLMEERIREARTSRRPLDDAGDARVQDRESRLSRLSRMFARRPELVTCSICA
jgi:hypothetical protein